MFLYIFRVCSKQAQPLQQWLHSLITWESLSCQKNSQVFGHLQKWRNEKLNNEIFIVVMLCECQGLHACQCSYRWYVLHHSTHAVTLMETIRNSTVKQELKLNSWMRVERALNTSWTRIKCELYVSWMWIEHKFSTQLNRQLNSWTWADLHVKFSNAYLHIVVAQLSFNSWTWAHLHWIFQFLHSWNSTELQLNLG